MSTGEGHAGERVLEATTAFQWGELARYKADKRFLDHYPDDFRTFWAPRDDIHGMLVSLLKSAQRSIVLNMFGYDDDEFDEVIRHKLDDGQVYVQISLDSRQAGSSKHEQAILEKWNNHAFGNSIAIGTSSRRAISHLKILIVDGIYTVRGSTNWSLSGEREQDNELTLSRDAVIAAETRAVLDLNHDWMLKQMAAKRMGKPKPREPAPKKKPRAPRPA